MTDQCYNEHMFLPKLVGYEYNYSHAIDNIIEHEILITIFRKEEVGKQKI